MVKYFMTIAGWFLALNLTAQDRQVHYLQLPANQIKKTYRSIASIQVMSRLADTSSIGVEPSASPNVRTDIVMSGGVQHWLQAYIDGQFAPSFQPSGKRITWVFNTLRAGIDSSSTGRISFVKLSAAIYMGTGDSSYLLLNTFDTAVVSTKEKFDIAANIVAVLTSLCEKSASSVSDRNSGAVPEGANTKPLTRSDLLLSIDSSSKIKILSARSYHLGIYLSFQEFLDNAPSFTNFSVQVDPASKSIRFYKLLPDSSLQIIPSVWGISVHNELYRYQEGQLYAIEKKGNGFTLSKYIDYRIRKNQAMYWRNNIGELQGDNNPYNDAHIYRAAVNKKFNVKAEATQLNMFTGNID